MPGSLAHASEPDPNEIYEVAQEYLHAGDLKAAKSAVEELHRLIRTIPEWDPSGAFTGELLPELEGKLARLISVVEKLDELRDQFWTTRVPEISTDADTVREYVNWATAAMDRLRSERDRVITELSSPEEHAALFQTANYREIQEILETGALRHMADVVTDVVRRLEKEDERAWALRTRLEEIKRGTVDLVLDRKKLQEELWVSRQRIDTYLNALAAVVTEGVAAPADGEKQPSDTVGSVFGTLLDQQLESMQAESSQSPAERESRLAALARYRHYNRVLTGAQVVPDQSSRIRALEQAVNRTPVWDGGIEPSRFSGFMFFLLLGLTLPVLAAGVLVIRRGRRRASAI